MDQAELNKRFDYHAPKGDQPDRYLQMRAAAKAFVETIDPLTPESREKSVALTNFESAMFWFNASIARNE